ncbi:MAG: hypothetical protein CVU22_06550 [Betaproteobacteria bacterium HGW-Betaproteobacteria-16]|nr:MAG: hypothetical protein CVU22_06550 [Betaproteobacteria bacterium HGW-Betaproteobacteria-16]
MSAGLGLSLIDRAVKESFAARCTNEDLERIRQYFLSQGAFRCLYCGSENPSRWDHLHAVSRGGDTVPGNLVPACQRCDDSKQDKDLAEWVNGKAKHRPPLAALPRIEAEVRRYQSHFEHEPRDFEAKLSIEDLAKYKRFRQEIEALRMHLKTEGLLK